MSLWTPDGEHNVEREGADAPESANIPPEGAGGYSEGEISEAFDNLSPADQERAQEMAAEMERVRAELAQAPAADVVANHAMGIYELAAIHLTQQPPNLEEGRLAIDGLVALLGGLEGRLGEAEATLREAVGQIQMAFVQLQSSAAND